MIQSYTKLNVADNTGAKVARCFRVLGGSKRRYARLADVVICSVKKADPHGTVKKKEVVRGVIIRTRKEQKRKDGTYIRFSDNALVLINKDGTPRGTRIFGPVARELKEKGFTKIVSLAAEIV